jgi:hypothetical protein
MFSNAEITKVALDVCTAICHDYNDGKNASVHPSALKGVVEAMKVYSSDIEMMKGHIMRLVERFLYVYGGKSENLADSGLMDQIVSAIYNNITVASGDIVVCKLGIKASNRMGARSIGEKGALDATIAAMKAYPGDKEVYATGCELLMVSCWNGHHDNKARIEALAGFPFIMELLKSPMWIYDGDNECILRVICAICGSSNVSHPPTTDGKNLWDKYHVYYSRLFGSLDACEVVFSLLAKKDLKYDRTLDVMEALCGLSLCEENQVKLVSLGIFPILKAMLNNLKTR